MTDDQIAGLVHGTKTQMLEHIEDAKTDMRERIEEAKTEMLERIDRTETTLLKEFRKWAVRMEARGRVADASMTGFNERLRVVEERLDDLEEA
jgi:hypothetical protein